MTFQSRGWGDGLHPGFADAHCKLMGYGAHNLHSQFFAITFHLHISSQQSQTGRRKCSTSKAELLPSWGSTQALSQPWLHHAALGPVGAGLCLLAKCVCGAVAAGIRRVGKPVSQPCHPSWAHMSPGMLQHSWHSTLGLVAC